MAKPYLPNSDQGKVTWLNNFSAKLATHGATVGVSPDEIASTSNDADEFSLLINLVASLTSAKEQAVSYKNLIRDAPLGSAGGDFPSIPEITLPATMVAPGIFTRVRLLVQRIKNHQNYTEAIGNDLDIIGAEETPPMAPSLLKPVLKLAYVNGHVDIIWTKPLNVSGIFIQVNRGDGQWVFLAFDTIPNYTDTMAITQLALWKYRGIYMLDDAQVGQWSDTVQIAVGQDVTA
ncbi:MAG: hypothetical protein KGZ58_04120 [Ignavibacteriales bacterium]|nr:hypothetical protein [Ignavibacteriales bacterium]